MPIENNLVQGLHICRETMDVSMGGARIGTVLYGRIHGDERAIENSAAVQDAIDLLQVLREKKIFTAADAREYFADTQEEIKEIDNLRDEAEEYRELYKDAEEELEELRREVEELKHQKIFS